MGPGHHQDDRGPRARQLHRHLGPIHPNAAHQGRSPTAHHGPLTDRPATAGLTLTTPSPGCWPVEIPPSRSVPSMPGLYRAAPLALPDPWANGTRSQYELRSDRGAPVRPRGHQRVCGIRVHGHGCRGRSSPPPRSSSGSGFAPHHRTPGPERSQRPCDTLHADVPRRAPGRADGIASGAPIPATPTTKRREGICLPSSSSPRRTCLRRGLAGRRRGTSADARALSST